MFVVSSLFWDVNERGMGVGGAAFLKIFLMQRRKFIKRPRRTTILHSCISNLIQKYYFLKIFAASRKVTFFTVH
jgi:hypothetical protein